MGVKRVEACRAVASGPPGWSHIAGHAEKLFYSRQNKGLAPKPWQDEGLRCRKTEPSHSNGMAMRPCLSQRERCFVGRAEMPRVSWARQ